MDLPVRTLLKLWPIVIAPPRSQVALSNHYMSVFSLHPIQCVRGVQYRHNVHALTGCRGTLEFVNEFVDVSMNSRLVLPERLRTKCRCQLLARSTMFINITFRCEAFVFVASFQHI